METLSGTVKRIRFQDEENGYVIATLDVGSDKPIPITGYMYGLREGANISVVGEWFQHQKYGLEIKVAHWTERTPTSIEGIQRYLAEGNIKGIGKVMAKRITDMFGDKTIEIFDKEPTKLLNVYGIGEVKFQQIMEGWREYRGVLEIMSALAEYGVVGSFAFKIYRQYKEDSVKVLKENPYALADEVDGIGFKTADKIAFKIGIEPDSYMRIKSGLKYTLKQESDKEGHCYLPAQKLVTETAKTLTINKDEPFSLMLIDSALTDAIKEGAFIYEDDNVYNPIVYHTERKVASNLISLANKSVTRPSTPNYDSKDANIIYNDIQRQAIREALNNSVYYITGGPGTGKTTIIKAIVNSCDFKRVLLAAPTGRAAKRMEEATGHEAKTIHRLLEATYDQGFKRNEDNPIEGDVLIVDECSMIDLSLMNSLLKALPKHIQLILVGDANQLPSVGAGNVLRDIINSDVIPGISLHDIMRQAEKSKIITNSHKIIKGEMPDLADNNSDFLFYPAQDNPMATAQDIVRLYAGVIPSQTGLNPMVDMQLLIPSYKGECGVDALNSLLQDALNPKQKNKETKIGNRTFRIGDKVMQLRNDYDKEVFNGDIGFIDHFDYDTNEIVVRFDENRKVAYARNEMDELTLAYAITIHKSQGSEYKMAIVVMISQFTYMSNRELLYTGVTRAKDCCLLVGQTRTLHCVIPKKGSARYTTLTERIVEENGNQIIKFS